MKLGAARDSQRHGDNTHTVLLSSLAGLPNVADG